MQLKKWGFAIGFCFAVVAILASVKIMQIRAAIEMVASFPEPMETVEYTQAKPGSWSPETSVLAETVAPQSLELRNELGGIISGVYFQSGEIIEKGTLLLSLEDDKEQAQLSAVQADLKFAESEYKRIKSVVERGAAPESELDQAEARRDALIADEQELLAIIAKMNIRAPFDARTGLHELETGQFLNPGEYLTDLVGINDHIWIDFSLPQQIATLKVGDITDFSASGFFDDRQPAQIIARSAMADRSSRNVRFRAEMPNSDGLLFAGMAMVAHVQTADTVEGLVLPTTAIRYDTEGPYVFVLNKIEDPQQGTHHAQRRQIEFVNERDQQVLVTSGLSPDETIATLGSFKLRENILVNAINPETANAPSL